jgi:hypothetical protein
VDRLQSSPDDDLFVMRRDDELNHKDLTNPPAFRFAPSKLFPRLYLIPAVDPAMKTFAFSSLFGGK